jgi:hypothetical protein
MPTQVNVSSTGTTTSGTSFVGSITTATAGNALIVVAGIQSGATLDITGCTDSASNTYTQRADTFHSGSNTRITVWDCLSISGSPTTVTITASGSASAYRLIVLEYSGLSAYDTSAVHDDAATTTPTAPSITTAQANELVVTGVNCGSSGATGTQSTSGFTTETASVFTGAMTVADGVVASAGSVSVPWTLGSSAGSAQIIAAWTAAAAAAATSQHPTNRARFRASNF